MASDGKHVYSGGNYLLAYNSDPVTGSLTNTQTLYGAYIASMKVDPSGRFLYAAGQSNQVFAYTIDAGNGLLTAIAGTPYTIGLSGSQDLVVDPTGKFVYVANAGNATVSGYSINQQTGALTALTGSPFSISGGVQAVVVDASGKFLYAGTSGQIQAYTIDSSTGALTAVSGSPFATGSCCIYFYGGMTSDPQGRYLFTANYNGTVSAFTIDGATGALTAATGSPFATTGENPVELAVDASGKFLYATNPNQSSVHAFSIGTGGVLTTVSGSPFAASQPYGITTTAVAAPAATLTSVAINPAPVTLTSSALGGTTQLQLLGQYSDGTTKFLTQSGTWTIANTSIAQLAGQGLVQTVAYGSTTITASYGGFTATTALNVVLPAVASVAVTPSSYTLASGTAVQFHATATYADSSTQDVTVSGTWSSSNATVATVSNTAGSNGLATGVNPGTVTIRCR